MVRINTTEDGLEHRVHVLHELTADVDWVDGIVGEGVARLIDEGVILLDFTGDLLAVNANVHLMDELDGGVRLSGVVWGGQDEQRLEHGGHREQ